MSTRRGQTTNGELQEHSLPEPVEATTNPSVHEYVKETKETASICTTQKVLLPGDEQCRRRHYKTSELHRMKQ